MTRRALVTGITGFIGGVLAKRLVDDGWQVHALIRSSSDIRNLPFASDVSFHVIEDGQDIAPIIAAARPDIVFHLASLYLADHRPDQVPALVGSNILFAAMLAEAMASTGVTRMVNTGTAWQQFHGAAYRPVNLYAATKQAAEDVLRYYTDARGLSVVTLRLFDSYGRGDKRRKLIQILIEAAQSGEALAMSPGDQIVDMTHVDDIVEGFLIAADRLFDMPTPLDEVHMLSGERYSVKQLAALVADAMQAPLTPNFGGRPYRAREVLEPVVAGVGDVLPGWKRRHGLRDYVADHRLERS